MNEKQQRVFSNQYFNINKSLLEVCGLWPNSSKLNRLMRRIFVHGLSLLLIIPQILALRKWCFADLPLCAENLAGFVACFIIILKHTLTELFEAKILKVYMMVADNWLTLTDPEELAILLDFTKRGHWKSFAYFSYIVVGSICYTQFSMVNPAMDLIFPSNVSRPKILVVRAEYIFDPYDYFYELYILYTIMGVNACFVVSAVDTTYCAMVHQCTGIFRIVQHRLVKATEHSDEKLARETMISAIELHKKGLQFSLFTNLKYDFCHGLQHRTIYHLKIFSETQVFYKDMEKSFALLALHTFVEIIESSYSSYFVIIIALTLLLSIGSCAIMESLKEPLIATKFLLFALNSIVHLFYLSWPGQLIIDESENIFRSTYCNSWYNSSKEVKWMLLIVMRRSIKPCVLTAGGLYYMNFENAGLILKTFVSYMAFALSLQ